HSALGVVQESATRSLEFRVDGKLTAGPEIKGNDLWVKSTWELDGKSQYAYSLDGRTFTNFGEPYQLTWGNYRGDRIGIYSFNNKGEAGYVDIDSFSYRYDSPATRSRTNDSTR